jgi:signal transduction histidine kinase
MRSSTTTVGGPPAERARPRGARLPEDWRGGWAARYATGLLIVFLSFGALFDAVSAAAGTGGAPTTKIALQALATVPQLVHSLPWLRRVRARWWRWTFTAQALLTFLPHLLYGADWHTGGFLAGSALLLFPTRASWLAFGLVVTAKGALLAAYSADPLRTVTIVVDVVVVTALATYALTRLTEVIAELHTTRAGMARAAVAQERLWAAREVYGLLGARLAGIAEAAGRARRLAAADKGSAATAVAEVDRAARQALADTRAASGAFRAGLDGMTAAQERPQARGVAAEPRLAFAMVIYMSVSGALANLAAILSEQRPAAPAVEGGGVGLAALVALQVHHFRPRSGRPRGWGWTLAAQALLVYLPIPVFGANWVGMSCYLALCVLVVLRPPMSWVAFGAITASVVPLFLVLPPYWLSHPDPTLGYWAAFLWTVLVFYGPVRLAALAVELRSGRAELTRMLLVGERLRVARDVHDLLGAGLSAIALKADVVRRLLAKDPARAQAELADIVTLSRRAATEAGAISADPDTTLELELAAARSALSAAGVHLRVAAPGDGLPARVDTTLAVVVREAVTNVLRHSGARSCVVELAVSGGTARLRVSNDGVTAPPEVAAANGEGGTGIENLRARVQALGGRLTAGLEDPDGERRFTLAAEVPLTPQTAARTTPPGTGVR